MSREFIASNRIVNINLGEIDFYGLMGSIPDELDQAKSSLKGLLEVGKVVDHKDNNQRSLGLFSKIPFAELDILQSYSGKELKLAAFTDDSSTFLGLFGEILSRLRFSILQPSAEFLEELRNNAGILHGSYQVLGPAAELAGKNTKELFAQIRYANFMSKYMGISEESVQSAVKDAFGLFGRS